MRLRDPQLLARYMEDRDMSQARLGRYAEVSRQFIHSLATGQKTTCTPAVAARVAIGGAGAPPAGPAPSTKPVIKRAWPDVLLPVLGYHTAASPAAWVKVLAGVGFRDARLTTAMQRWLKSLGYYRGFIDGSFGKMTARALQSFLKAKGHYRGLLDGARGPLTIRAEVAYLNAQARYYKES